MNEDFKENQEVEVPDIQNEEIQKQLTEVNKSISELVEFFKNEKEESNKRLKDQEDLQKKEEQENKKILEKEELKNNEEKIIQEENTITFQETLILKLDENILLQTELLNLNKLGLFGIGFMCSLILSLIVSVTLFRKG